MRTFDISLIFSRLELNSSIFFGILILSHCLIRILL